MHLEITKFNVALGFFTKDAPISGLAHDFKMAIIIRQYILNLLTLYTLIKITEFYITFQYLSIKPVFHQRIFSCEAIFSFQSKFNLFQIVAAERSKTKARIAAGDKILYWKIGFSHVNLG